MCTLLTFLGRVPKTEKGYRTTAYAFPDGRFTDPVAFFGWSLQQRIRARRLVILGTNGSMWDHLFEGDLDLESENEEERLALIQACAEKRVGQAQLDALAPVLARKLGCEVVLRIIPYCRDESEQVELLRLMAEIVKDKENVHLDVTHGFRHLPMLALLAALYLRIVRRARILGIWYGSFDPDSGQALVHDLAGLLKIADGLQALASFDKDGDYGVFAPILKQAGLPEEAAQTLRRAAYFENILNVSAATGELRRVRRQIETAALEPDGALLLPAIRERLDWLDETRQFEKQIRLARSALKNRDYLRATLYAYEAVITQLCRIAHVPIEDFDARETVRKYYEKQLKTLGQQDRDDYHLLKNLRNQLAHGTRGSLREVQQALLKENRMRETLERLLKRIEDEQLPARQWHEALPRPLGKLVEAAAPSKGG